LTPTFLDGILTETGANHALLDHGKLGGQGAGAQQNREVVRRFHGEIAGDLPAAAQNRLANDRRRDHLVVEHDGERPPHVLLGDLGKFAGAGGIEFEVDHWFAGALVEGRLRVGELLARNDHPLLQQIGLPVLSFRTVHDFRFRRRPALQRLLGRHRAVDQTERQLRGLAENIEELLRIAETGHLHQNAIVSLALDRRLHKTQLIDALADDLDRLVHDLADALEDRRLGRGQPHQPAAGILDIEGALAGGAGKPAERLRQLPELCKALLQIVFANAHLDRVAANDRGAGQPNPLGAQDPTHVVLQREQLLPPHVVGVDLEQDVRAALQVEAEHDVALRPIRPALHHGFRKEIRDGKQADDTSREQDRQRLPLRNVKHGSSRFAPRLVASKISARVLLDRLTLGANPRDHRAHLAHAHPVRDLDFDLVVVDDLGDLADQPA